jgi:hypothetical protein
MDKGVMLNSYMTNGTSNWQLNTVQQWDNGSNASQLSSGYSAGMMGG